MKVLEDSEKDTEFKQYDVIISLEAEEDRRRIYEYIAYYLYAINAADKLINLIEKELSRLEHSPELYPKIEKMDELKRKYRRIVIKNYVILYTIDFENQKVFVSRVIYGRRNYINNHYL